MSSPFERLKVSVVIITAGRRQCLPPCIDSLRRQTYSPLEIVVVVGPSKDGSQGYAKTLTDAKVCSVDKLNVAYARNEGVRQAGGEIIAFIDDDAVAHPRWLEELVSVFEREGPRCGGVAGFVINENGPGRPIQAFNNTINDLGEPKELRLAPPESFDPAAPEYTYFMGANMAFRREAILACGGFDETCFYLYEDADMSVAVKKAGYSVLHHTRAVVHHFPAVSHNRRSAYELNYYANVRQQTYFALKFSQKSTAYCFWYVARSKKEWLNLFIQQIRLGNMTVRAALRYTFQTARGLASGLKNGRRFRREGREPVLGLDLPRPDFKAIPRPQSRIAAPSNRKSLRIALVCGEFGGPLFGGVGRYTRHLAEALGARGHDVTVLRSGAWECLVRPEGYKVVNIPPSPDQIAYRYGFMSCLARLSERRDFDIVEAPLWQGEGSAIGASGRWPLVIRLQTPFELIRQISEIPLDPIYTVMVASEQLELTYASGVIGISKAVVDTVEKTNGIPLEAHGRRLTVIPLGMPGAGELVKKPIETPSHGGTRYLFVGRLEARKGVLELARAFAQVAEEDPRATLWIMGADNSIHDGFLARTGGDYIQAMKRQWSENVARRVHFFGRLEDEEKNYLFSQCDVLVAPSVYESFGLIFLEAMRYGKPVIGTDVGGIPEVVADGITGLLVPPEAPEPLAQAMLRLGASTELRRRFGANGLKRFEETFSLYSYARQTENFYRQVLEEWHGRSFNAPGVRSTRAEVVPLPAALGQRVA